MTTPAQNTPAFTLEPPAPVGPIDPAATQGLVPVQDAVRTEQETRAAQAVDRIAALEPQSPEFTQIVDGIYTVGADQIAKSSQMSNRMLERPAIQGAPDSATNKVGKSLVDLRTQVTELDPNRADLTGPKRLLKWLPGGNKVENYFRRYESAQAQLDAILASLSSGQDELRKDNAALDVERTHMWETMGTLTEQETYLAALDEAVAAKIEHLRTLGETEKATALESDVLHAVRSRRTDIATQMAVNAQGYLAMDLIKKNNTELVRGVERAKTTTISALRTAVIISQALGQQAIVLSQIKGLNETTSNMIASSAAMLRQQGAEINRQASESTIDVDKLAAAWDDVTAAMNEVDQFKAQANQAMVQTIGSLQEQTQKASTHLERSARQAGHISAPQQDQVPSPQAINPAPVASQQTSPAPRPAAKSDATNLKNPPW